MKFNSNLAYSKIMDIPHTTYMYKTTEFQMTALHMYNPIIIFSFFF